ncbi:toxin Cry1Ac domain D-VI-related protein [Lactiplantibacillus xiangfangensis]|uniref:toxin Cry1Ac domain D-VI-related protein n=1 Tax=Lactiplantibacillus xiangfangensis TaxID=942150 RepID=UPI00385063EF
MKKVVTGAAILASLLLLVGCSSSNKSSKSASSSTKIAKKVAESESSSQKVQKLDNATTDVDSLFSDSKHTALVPAIKKSLIDGISKEVNKLPSSDKKTNLQKDIKKAYALYPKLASSVASSNANSDAKAKSKSESESAATSSKKASSTEKTLASTKKAESSSANKYAKKIMDLGVPDHATDVSYSGHTVTWTGFDAWKDYTHPELEKLIAFLETITYQQSPKYHQQSPKLVVKLSNGTQIAHEEPGQSLVWDN